MTCPFSSLNTDKANLQGKDYIRLLPIRRILSIGLLVVFIKSSGLRSLNTASMSL